MAGPVTATRCCRRCGRSRRSCTWRREGVSESRYQPLYRHDPLISPEADWTVAAEVTHQLGTPTATQLLGEQVAALALLTDASTARLERPCRTPRYGWLPVRRLAGGSGQSAAGGHAGDRRSASWRAAQPAGLHLGHTAGSKCAAEAAAAHPVQLPPDLETVFGAEPPLMSDPASGGHLLAPSLNQAVTASILRSAYLANAGTDFPEAFAVNLSSDRVRGAIEIIDGVRTGQSLSALLGYALERGLHDRSGFAEVDIFIYALRRVFPLAAEQLQFDRHQRGNPDRPGAGPRRRRRAGAGRPPRQHGRLQLSLRPELRPDSAGLAGPADRARHRVRPAAQPA